MSKETRVIVRKEIDPPLNNPGVTYPITVSTGKILSFRANRSIQTEETKIRLLLSNRSDQRLHSCHSVCAFVFALFYGRTGVTGGINSMGKAGCACSIMWNEGCLFFLFFFCFVFDQSIPFLFSFFSFFFFFSFLGDGLTLDGIRSPSN